MQIRLLVIGYLHVMWYGSLRFYIQLDDNANRITVISVPPSEQKEQKNKLLFGLSSNCIIEII